jgi:hypothetical protein
MPARLSKRQQRELEELTHADEIDQVVESSEEEGVPLASPLGQSAFAAVSQGYYYLFVNAKRISGDQSF